MINAEHKNILEALLFASATPLEIRALHDRMPDGADVGALLLELREEYSDRGIRLVEADRHWAFRTAPDLAEHLQVQKDVQKKLSRAAMESLAIIAYHQPVTRTEIENVRGVATHRGTLDLLIEMGWVKPGRRRETPGRPMTWVTTNAFLDQFSIESVLDLPGLDDLKASGLLDRRPAIDALPDPDLFDGSSDEELEAGLPAEPEAGLPAEPEAGLPAEPEAGLPESANDDIAASEHKDAHADAEENEILEQEEV